MKETITRDDDEMARVKVSFFVLILLGSFIAGGVLVTGATAHSADQHENLAPADEESFVVSIQDDGDAHLEITYLTYNLGEQTQEQAFQAFRDDDAQRENQTDTFETQWQSVAASASAATGRSMTVSNISLDFASVNGTGLVTMTLDWSNFAAVDNGTLRLTEPFSSGFSPQQAMYIAYPSTYEATTVTPAANSTGDTHLRWDTGRNLSGFELSLTEQMTGDGEDGGGNETTDGEEADDGGPGFGVLVGIAAVLTLARIGYARRTS